MILSARIMICLLPLCFGFHVERQPSRKRCSLIQRDAEIRRRSLLQTAGVAAVALAGASSVFIPPVVAGIDVSGLRSNGEPGNNVISSQIRALDGSASARVQEIKTTGQQPSFAARVAEQTVTSDPAINDPSLTAATYAYRYAPGFNPKLTKTSLYGTTLRCDDQLVSPSGKGYLSVSFEFPADWLQLDRLLGGIQYVDQRNGDKLYLLRAKLPADSTVANVPKTFFGDAIFDPQGTLVRSGITVEEYKVKSSVILSDGSLSAPHRRLLIKYATVTGNGLRTERRALVDAYQIDSVAYMIVTSSNAVKFDAKGRERDTVEAIVDSFRIEQVF